MVEVPLIEAIRLALDQEMARDDRVVLIGQDIGPRGGVFRATRGLYEKYGPQRVIDTPLGPSALVGVAIGAAMYGFRPVCEIQFADFIYPALGQIINEAAKIHYRSNGSWTVPLVLRVPYGGGVRGGLYHSQSVEAFLTHVPGLKVVIPSNPRDARGLLTAAICDPNPVLFLEPKLGYRTMHGEVPEGDSPAPIGPANVTRPGKTLSVFAYGMLHAYALQAAGRAARRGVEAEVVDLRTLYPVDEETILASVRKTGRALIVHEDHLTGGYGAEIAALLAEKAFNNLDAPVRRLAGPDIPAVPYSRPLQDWFMPGPDRIEAAIMELASS